MAYANLGAGIEYFLHNYLDGSCIVFLLDGRSAYLVFRRLGDSNSSSALECREVTDGAPISSASVDLPMGVSYDLYYDQVLEIYAPFVAPDDSVRKTPFLRELSNYFDIAFLEYPGTWIIQRFSREPSLAPRRSLPGTMCSRRRSS